MHRVTRSMALASNSTIGAEGEHGRNLMSLILIEIQKQGPEHREVVESLRQSFEGMEERFSEFTQLSQRSNNFVNENVSDQNVLSQGKVIFENQRIDSKLLPEAFDGSGSLNDFLVQFDLISRVMNLEENKIVLISKLRGEARSILEGM